MPNNYPVIVGAGQITNRARDLRDAREPLDLMTEAARKAEQDAGVAGLLARADSVRVVSVLSWPSLDPPADLAGRLGAAPGDRVYTTIGGNTPQWLVNETAEAIARGDVHLALLAGAEAMHSLRLARKAGQQPDWSPRGRPKATAGDTRFGVSDVEHLHGASQAITVYPLFENALRAYYGRSIEEHQRALGALCARFTKVAAQHPNAWFPQVRSAEELAAVSAENRMVGFPYPKYMNAIMDVDQSAALIMTSAAAARELGVPEDRWVYLHGCGDATEHWYVTERVNYHSAPAIHAAGRRALAMAGAGIDDIAAFDLYSCFPSAVQLGRDALGIPTDDPRPLTVTGGLPYFGGPGNNYTMHGIATMTDRLRAHPDQLGLVSGLGWWATKHAIGVYGARAPTKEWARTDPKVDQAAVDAMPHPPFVAAADGPATVETYTVTYDREGTPALGIVIGRLEDDRRFIANVPAKDRALLDSMTSREFVGARGSVRNDTATGINRFSA